MLNMCTSACAGMWWEARDEPHRQRTLWPCFCPLCVLMQSQLSETGLVMEQTGCDERQEPKFGIIPTYP